MVRHIPSVQRRIDKEMAKVRAGFEHDIQKGTKAMGYYTTIPTDGLSQEAILETVDAYLALGDYKWKEGRVSGAVYKFDEELIELIKNVYGKTSYTNPLHPDIFPGVCKMEAEVVRMTANLFSGGPKTCGTVCRLLCGYQYGVIKMYFVLF